MSSSNPGWADTFDNFNTEDDSLFNEWINPDGCIIPPGTTSDAQSLIEAIDPFLKSYPETRKQTINEDLIYQSADHGPNVPAGVPDLFPDRPFLPSLIFSSEGASDWCTPSPSTVPSVSSLTLTAGPPPSYIHGIRLDEQPQPSQVPQLNLAPPPNLVQPQVVMSTATMDSSRLPSARQGQQGSRGLIAVRMEAAKSSKTLRPKQPRLLSPVSAVTSKELWRSRSPSRSSSPGVGKKRNLPDPAKTKGVRDVRACIPCKVRKVECDSDSPCGKCKKFDQDACHRLCMRDKPSDVLNKASTPSDRWVQSHPALTNVPDKSRQPQLRQPVQRHLFLAFFPDDGPQSCLHLHLEQHAETVFVIPQGSYPSDESVDNWCMKSIENCRGTRFRESVERLVLALASNKALEKAWQQYSGTKNRTNKVVEKQQELLEKLLILACLRKVCCESIYCRHASEHSKAYLLPPSIAVHLKLQAEQRISVLEKDLAELLDGYFALNDIRYKGPPLFAMWASLWYSVLFYREVLERTETQPPVPEIIVQPQGNSFTEVAMKLYDGLVILLSSYFRTSNVLKGPAGLEGATITAFGNNPELFEAFQRAWVAHHDFYEEVRSQNNSRDSLLIKHVINHEKEVGERKVRRKQG